MSFETGLFTDLSDSNTIADPVVLVAAEAVKLSPFLGSFWNDMAMFTEPTSNRKFDIYSRSETQRSGAIGTGGWDDTAITALPVVSTVGLIKGLVLQVATEVVVVNEILSATTISVVSRGAAGTTAAAHLAAVAYSVIGSAINDKDLKDIDSVSEITNIFANFMQTVAEPIDWTKGGELDPRDGISTSMMALLQEEAMTRVAKNIYSSSIFGLKQQKVGDNPYMTAGLIQQLTDTTGGRLVLESDVSGAFTEAALRSALRTVTKNGAPTDIYLSYANKDIANSFNAASSNIAVNTGRTDNQAGYFVNSYDYEGLVLNIKIDANMPNDTVGIVNINKCQKGWKANDALMYHNETPASSREFRSSFNGSYGIAVADVGYEHIAMTGITT